MFVTFTPVNNNIENLVLEDLVCSIIIYCLLNARKSDLKANGRAYVIFPTIQLDNLKPVF